MIKRVLTIAGSDSGGGAGIQADLKTFTAFGVFGMSVITAVTAQNSTGVTGIEGISPDMIRKQFLAVYSDMGVDAAKTGMLWSREIIIIVSGLLKENPVLHVVVDPVMVSKSGDRLLDPHAIQALRHHLIPLATLVTPNLPEAEVLADISVRSVRDMKEAAKKIYGMGCQAVLIKGGHRRNDAMDILFNGSSFEEFPAPRIRTVNTHGTGCTYSSAIAALLSLGNPMALAVSLAKN